MKDSKSRKNTKTAAVLAETSAFDESYSSAFTDSNSDESRVLGSFIALGTEDLRPGVDKHGEIPFTDDELRAMLPPQAYDRAPPPKVAFKNTVTHYDLEEAAASVQVSTTEPAALLLPGSRYGTNSLASTESRERLDSSTDLSLSAKKKQLILPTLKGLPSLPLPVRSAEATDRVKSGVTSTISEHIARGAAKRLREAGVIATAEGRATKRDSLPSISAPNKGLRGM